ncbi:MAG: DUF11 domain-containing protein, partial [Nitrospirota bacterium]
FTQLNTDGFGTANNTTIGDIKVLNNKVYVGTANATDGGQVWSIHIEADLSLAMSVDNSTPRTGDTVQYDLTLTNNGPETATGIGVTNTLSSDTAYTGSSIGLGSYNGSTGVWTINSLPSGDSARITIMATVTGTTAGTVITNSAEVTSTAITSDSDSTPNNASTSEDDYASASSTILATATGGTSTFSSGGGGSSGSTVKTLSGEEEESEPVVEEPEEEEVIEEPVEEPEPVELTEEEINQEENILEEATKTVTTIVTEIVPTLPPTPPPTPQPKPTYQPPAPVVPPAPPAPQSSASLSQEITSAIEKYVETISTVEEITPIYKPIKEIIIEKENEGKESVDSDKDGISDLFQLSRGIPIGNDNPDNDDYSNSTELYCDLNPLEPDVLGSTPQISTLREGVTTGNEIVIRICSGTVGDTVDVVLVKKEEIENHTYLGQIEIDEENKGVILLQEPLEDGEYYVLAKGKEGLGKVASFKVQNAIVPQAPILNLISEKKELGKTVRFVIAFNGEEPIADEVITKIQGYSEPGLIVYATWQSRILSSVVISDALQGEFVLEIPLDLPKGEHEIFVYSYDEKEKFVSNVTRLILSN